MKCDLRFNLQHAGDIFSDAVHMTADSAMAISKSVIRNYDHKSLHYKKKNLFSAITTRLSGLIQSESFVSTVQKTADSAVVITKKAIRAYDLNSLHTRKKKVSDEIIERVSALTTGDSSDVTHDAALTKLVARLNEIEKELAGYKKQNARQVSPVTTVVTKLGKSLFGVK